MTRRKPADDPDDLRLPDRFLEMVVEARLHLEASMPSHGASFAVPRAAAFYDASAALSEGMSGLEYLRTLRALEEQVRCSVQCAVYSAVQYSTVQYCTVLNSTVQTGSGSDRFRFMPVPVPTDSRLTEPGSRFPV